MMSLDRYLQSKGLTQEALAARVGLSNSYLNQLVNRKRRASPEIARRIEEATSGEVSAASLLGVAETGGEAVQLGPRRWVVRPGANGDVTLPARLLRELGFELGEALALRSRETGVALTSTKQDLADAQAFVAKHAAKSGSVVQELLAERRAEADRE